MTKERLSQARLISEGEFLIAMERIMDCSDDKTRNKCMGMIDRANNYLANNIICDFFTDGSQYWIEPRAKGKIGYRT